jgi:hypothetical protein
MVNHQKMMVSTVSMHRINGNRSASAIRICAETRAPSTLFDVAAHRSKLCEMGMNQVIVFGFAPDYGARCRRTDRCAAGRPA